MSVNECRPLSIFCHFTWLGGGLKWNQGEIRVIGVKSFNTVFINPDIKIYYDFKVASLRYFGKFASFH